MDIKNQKNIQFLHRAIIAKSLNDNVPITKIAKELRFSRQTIHNEIARGTIEHKKTDLTIEYVYDPYAAQSKCEEASHWKGRLSKIDDFNELISIIENGIKDKMSPEVITHYIQEQYNENKLTHTVCFKIIYVLYRVSRPCVSARREPSGQIETRDSHCQSFKNRPTTYNEPDGDFLSKGCHIRADTNVRIFHIAVFNCNGQRTI